MPSGQPITADQLKEAVRLQGQFWTLDRIANKLGLHPASVCRALSRHNRKVFARMEKRADSLKAKQVAQLETIASEAFEGWLNSKNPSTYESDAGLLNQARGALADIRKVLGLDAPRKSEVKSFGQHEFKPGPHTLTEEDPRFMEDGEQPTVEGTEERDAPA